MENCLLGLTLGLIAGAYIVAKCKEAQSFVNNAEKEVTQVLNKVDSQIKKVAK
ncbi:MAG: hypothetical protein FWD32_01120 [Firmicutes bacterium]|nr:hypothetical protein [Bacillota bacterium]